MTGAIIIIVSVAVLFAFGLGYEAGRTDAPRDRWAAAVRTLTRMGWYYNGGEEWRRPQEPPKRPGAPMPKWAVEPPHSWWRVLLSAFSHMAPGGMVELQPHERLGMLPPINKEPPPMPQVKGPWYTLRDGELSQQERADARRVEPEKPGFKECASCNCKLVCKVSAQYAGHWPSE